MIIDCQSCEVRDIQCADCVVTALLGRDAGIDSPVRDQVDLDPAETVALGVLADSGLVSPLRLISVRKSGSSQYQSENTRLPGGDGGIRGVG